MESSQSLRGKNRPENRTILGPSSVDRKTGGGRRFIGGNRGDFSLRGPSEFVNFVNEGLNKSV